MRGETGTAVQALIADKQNEVAALCRRYSVRRLELFGSAVRDDFDPGRSDVDLLVEFERNGSVRALDAYMGLKEGLEALFGRPVDLVEAGAVRNPYLKESIECRELLYAA